MKKELSLEQRKKQFENCAPAFMGAKMTFAGSDGYTVYNPSIPFIFRGNRYIFGRVEKLELWADSKVYLFVEENGIWNRCLRFGELKIEDPFIAFIKGEIILGGVVVEKINREIKNYYCNFYRGSDLFDLQLFARGPDSMKDIRLAELRDGRIAVFSRPRSEELREKYGSEAMMGFTVIEKIEQLNPEIIEKARLIEGVFGKDEWGGPNQLYALDSGYIGIIGHQSYMDTASGYDRSIYVNTAYVFCPERFSVIDARILATRACFPKGGTKTRGTDDVAFTSGVVRNGKGVILYSGLNDCEAGYVEIEDPFKKYGGVKPFEIYG